MRVIGCRGLLLSVAFVGLPSVGDGQAPILAWTQRTPGSRSGAAMAYDSARHELVLEGGDTLGTLCETDGSAWTPRGGAAIPPRSGCAMAYDSQRHVTVVFGGSYGVSSTVYRGDTWEWDGLGWVARNVPGPSARTGAAMAYDSRRGVCVLYGGVGGSGSAFAETWEWDGSVWTRRQVSGPQPISGYTMVYDSLRGVMVLFGGSSAGIGETWEWGGSSWVQRATSGPGARGGAAMTFDSARGVAVLFGGTTAYTGQLSDTWEWDGMTWVQRAMSGPPARYGAGAAYDEARGVSVIFGGSADNFYGTVTLGDTWEWDGVSWRLTQSQPTARNGHSTAFDSRRGVIVLFGGADRSPYAGDLWEWDGTAWDQRFPGGNGWTDSEMSYDSQRGVSVLFGGVNGTGNPRAVYGFGEWDGSNWLSPSPPPPGPGARAGHCLAYDSRRGVTVMVGGSDTAMYFHETWEWNGTIWALRATDGPSGRGRAAMAFDAARGVTVLFGGDWMNDTWEWDGTTWTQRSTTGPGGRVLHMMAYDSHRHLVVMYGGFSSGGNPFQDVWAWDGSDWFFLGSGPVAATGDELNYDSVRDRLVLVGAQVWDIVINCVGPSVAAGPVSQTVCSSGLASFGVAPGGTPPFTYQWQVETSPGEWADLGTQPVPLACGGSAVATTPMGRETQIGIEPCRGVDEYRVRCIVSSECGSVASEAAAYRVCYANCDCSGTAPVLNVNDFLCFQVRFAAGDPFANCDGSSVPPVLNVNDFLCFQSRFVAGCP